MRGVFHVTQVNVCSFACSVFRVATADHPVHIFNFGTGFMFDGLPDVTLPFYPGLGPTLSVAIGGCVTSPLEKQT